MIDLSIVIPSRNEIFLARTIQDILTNARGSTEVIAVLDGAWADPPIPDHPRVTLIYHPISIGQRAAANDAARAASGKYIMKVDAHCAFDEGFDVKLMADMQPDWTVVPNMKNLHTFDWVCKNGHRRYQGPSGPCLECGELTTRDVVWIARKSPNSTSYCFDTDLHFQYFGEFKKRKEGQGDLTETLSLQGSCFMMTRERYFDLNICDEAFGSWGQQGVEVALKSWLSGGRVVVNHKTWYAHQFRTQGGDFGFPYPLSGSQVAHARKHSQDLFLNNRWERQVRPLSWLLEKFAPVPYWHDGRGDGVLNRVQEAGIRFQQTLKHRVVMKPAILYYTCNTHSQDIEEACRKQLLKSGLPIVSVSREKEIDFADTRIVLQGARSPLMMHKQIVAGLEACKADYVFLCESDVLYHPSHFDFTPKWDDTYYFNTNVWKTRYPDGHCIWTDDLQQVSGICASRELLLDFFRRRVRRIERDGFNGHYEPGPRYGCKVENWQSAVPNIDIRHEMTITKSKWSPEEFRNKEYAKGWKEASEVPGWGMIEGKLIELLHV